MTKISDRNDITKTRPIFTCGIYDVSLSYDYIGKPAPRADRNDGIYTHFFHGMSHKEWDKLPDKIRSYFNQIGPLINGYHEIRLREICIYEQASGDMVASSQYEPWLEYDDIYPVPSKNQL